MTDQARAIQAAFGPIISPLVPALINTIGTTSAVLLTDILPNYPVRRLHIVNTHATQDLALFLVPNGQAAGAETVTTLGGLVVLARSTGSFLIGANFRVLVVGSNAATTFSAVSSDT